VLLNPKGLFSRSESFSTFKTMTAESIIKQYGLKPHPEGGYYLEIFRSDIQVASSNNKSRSACTSIFYLLNDQEKSHFHRLSADELWFYHFGEAIEIIQVTESGYAERIMLGSRFDHGEQLQATIKANTWFAARVKDGRGFGLVSCVVAPGFEFIDFELGKRDELTSTYPKISDLIKTFTI